MGVATSGESCTYNLQPLINIISAGIAVRRYAKAIEQCGLGVEVLPPDDLPDSVFVEDHAIYIASVSFLTRPGADCLRDPVLGGPTTNQKPVPRWSFFFHLYERVRNGV